MYISRGHPSSASQFPFPTFVPQACRTPCTRTDYMGKLMRRVPSNELGVKLVLLPQVKVGEQDKV